MGTLRSTELYKLEIFGRGFHEQAFCDLLVLDMRRNVRNVYLANVMSTDIRVKSLAANMQEVRTGRIVRAEGNEKESLHKNEITNIYIHEKNFFHVHDSKVDDLLQMMFVAKNARPNVKDRQDWQAEEEQRLQNGESPRRAPEELILAWDGDFKKTIYQVLNDRYNTPMLEDWQEYIVDTLIADHFYSPLEVRCYGREHALEAGLLSITERQLEEIITQGILAQEIYFDPSGSNLMSDGRSEDEGILKDCNGLDDYLTHFAGALGSRIQENTALRFDPMRDRHSEAFYDVNLHANQRGITGLFPPQADTVMGAAKTLIDDRYVFLVCEMGTGKTVMGEVLPYITEAIDQAKRNPDPFRTIVFVPTIMVSKWMREIQDRIPGAKVIEIKSYRDIIPLQHAPYKPETIEYYVMSSDVAKADYPIVPVENWRERKGDAKQSREEGKKARLALHKSEFYADGHLREYVMSGDTGFYCPDCGQPLKVGKGRNEKMSDVNFYKTRNSSGKMVYDRKVANAYCTNLVATKYMPSHRIKTPGKQMHACGYNLWQPMPLKDKSLNRKVSPAWFINNRLRRGFFKYLIADEVHEYKSGDTDRANAFGQLVNHTTKQILLTGTLLGGQASDLFYLIARLDSRRLKREGITYNDINGFIERYGVFEHKFRMVDDWEGASLANTASQTRKKSGRSEKPGVSPQVFSRFLISNCAFLELSDLAQALPRYREEPIFVEMHPDHLAAYRDLEEQVGSQMRSNVAQGGMKHVSTYVNRIYQYADMPFNQSPITYYDDQGRQRTLATPINFSSDDLIPTKYNALTNMIDAQIRRERKTMVYCRFTGVNPVDLYLYNKLKAEGYNVGILRSSGKDYDGLTMPKQEDREKWLRQMMDKNGWDVLITNPRLVSVGLDLLDFPTIVYYQMDYSTYNYMQSCRRSWRIKQTKDVEVYTLVYQETMQADVLNHIAKKIDAALALQGKFSEEGLRAMAETGDGINALAKRLMREGTLDGVDSIEDRWKRINEARDQSMQSVMNFGYESYDETVMNPLGLEEVRRIAQGMIASKQADFAAGKISAEALDDYLKHMEDMMLSIQDASKYNKGLRKKDRVIEGQIAFSF
ncbi:hypothetical protein GZH47_33355 (plasmid) [Paenibacillus rhizovicinus]|uniref:Helicase C-terminal domain-containing protein n=1 Tax=Paenibacillus rhizovicinus TaxID=2704463 RepID=A0A6C0PCK8_9BACL|nr:helicase-related protein [Paenibacillus rhizovicinus]QHW35783.1 hypothetical protein GZH47_33355 [Paenibacillus rhizovicinus]